MSAFLLHPPLRLPSPRSRAKRTAICAATPPPLSRRVALRLLSLSAMAVSVPPIHAAPNPVSAPAIEKSELYGYSYTPPSDWTRNTASLSSFREATVFLAPDGDSNISMVATPVPGDFQKLSSFGSVSNVLVRNIPSLLLLLVVLYFQPF